MSADGYEFNAYPMTYRVLDMSNSTVGVCDIFYVSHTADIPDYVYGYNKNSKVTEILPGAFNDKHNIYMSIIPSTIEHIPNGAFFGAGTVARYVSGPHGSDAHYVHTPKYPSGISFNAIDCEIGTGIYSYFYNNIEQLTLKLFHIGPDVEVLPQHLPQYSINGNLFISDNVKVIEEDALQGTQKAIVIGKNVTEIKEGAIKNCRVIYSSALEPPVCYENSFGTTIDSLFVPQGTIEKYETADYWKSAGEIIEREYVATKSFKFTEDTIIRNSDDNFIPQYDITSTNATSNKISWISTNPNVATIDSDGKITPHSHGETDIYASVDSLLARCHVIFNPAYVDTAYLVNKFNRRLSGDTIVRNLDHSDLWRDIYLYISPVTSTYYKISSNQVSNNPVSSSEPPYYKLKISNPDYPCVKTLIVEVKQYKDSYDYSHSSSIYVTPIKVFTDSLTIIYERDPEYYTSIVFNAPEQPWIVPLDTEMTLKAFGKPNNAKNKEISWSVPSQEIIMSYVNNDGYLVFTGMSDGEVTVTAYVTKDPSVRAECKIIVSSDYEAIDNVVVSPLDDNVDVYTMQGQLLRCRVPYDSATQGLPPGIYIVGHKKVIVR